MEKTVLILTLSSKFGGVCVAGIDQTNNEFIRIVDNTQQGSNDVKKSKLIDFDLNRAINLLDIVRISGLIYAETPMQPENYSISDTTKFNIIGSVSRNNLDEVYNCCVKFDKSNILGSSSYKLSPSTLGSTHSLEMISFEDASLYTTTNSSGQRKTKIDFNYNGNRYYEYSVTDSNEYLKSNETKKYSSGYLVVSIPDDDWSSANGYFKFVATIFHD